MDSIYITGGAPLKGRIPISGAKNAALTLMPCALLTDETVTLENLPRLADVDNFSHLLNQLGVSTSVAGVKKGEFGRRMTLQAKDIASTVAPYDMVRRMRASILVLGPMLARAGESTVSLPGGCALATGPIDLTSTPLKPWRRDRAGRWLRQGDAPKGRLTGGDYSFPVVSVGATEMR
jgi:UDP-N-acetylglucosamine 1-carboxyvinyltransferase